MKNLYLITYLVLLGEQGIPYVTEIKMYDLSGRLNLTLTDCF